MSKLFVLLITIGAAAAIQKVPVTIYYETLCADSIKFFNKQFTPTWRDLDDYIDVKLVPAGRSNSSSFANPNYNPSTASFSDDITWICSHGPNECTGNKLQSCVVAPNSGISTDSQVLYIDCLMANGKKEVEYITTATTCAAKTAGISLPNLISCASGTDGKKLLWENERKTRALQPPLAFVPTIVFENRYDQAESDMALTSFRSTLCKHIKESPKPKLCDGNGGVRLTTTGLMTLISAGVIFRLL